ncbi:MAG: hypothetical protein JSU08_07540 [Acidobacteria bacterium]|nr:hypothetical protein [Acidobacteriota bacterium]
MGRTGGMLIGLIVGVVLAGVAVALLIPLAPAAWHTRPITSVVALGVMAVCAGVAYLLSAPTRE